MSSRAGLRLFQLSRATKTPFRKPLGRRYQAVDAAPTPHTQSMFQRLWNSPVGVKTVHFWYVHSLLTSQIAANILARAPVMKVDSSVDRGLDKLLELTHIQWSIVLAGVSDFSRPAENLSLTQNVALTCTGAIWTRWCFIIKPQNILYVLHYLRSRERSVADSTGFLAWRPLTSSLAVWASRKSLGFYCIRGVSRAPRLHRR